jgi:Reverse transcriptase (RNA-dependent DNA polymerase)
MRRLVLGWKMLGLERSLASRIVTYADDLVILCRRGKGEEALARMRQLMGKLKLTVNEEKTRSCKVPEGEFNFLGYTFAQFCAATFLIRAWQRWVTSAESWFARSGPHLPQLRKHERGTGRSQPRATTCLPRCKTR